MELSEDAAANGVKYFEVSIDPYKFISKVREDTSLHFTALHMLQNKPVGSISCQDRSQSRVLDVVRTVTSGLAQAATTTGASAGLILQYQVSPGKAD